MFKIIFLSLSTFVVLSATAQVQTQIIGDSVFVHSNTSTGELILQNSTDTVNGFLHNKGAGRTEFRRVLVKINDSVYVIGVDTLNIHSQGSSGTVTNVATGYGLTGGPITTTGTIIVDSAALHLKFLGLADSIIYYPYASNPKNYLTSTKGWSTTGNSGTTGGTNFIGTTDNVPINFRVNNALVGTIGTTSNYNVSFGALSLPNTSTGIKNGAIGGGALGKNTTGFNNFAIGYTALYNNLTGANNTANGWSVMGFDSAGIGNTAMGAAAMGQTGGAIHIGGSYNSALGYRALIDNFNNKYNIGLGYMAGSASGSSNTLYIADSTYHMKYQLDSASGVAPNEIGKDGSGFWHVYEAPIYGTATLAAGTVTVSTALVKTGAKIFVSVNTPGGTQGFLSASVASIVNGTSFVINSTSATETSTVNWQIIN